LSNWRVGSADITRIQIVAVTVVGASTTEDASKSSRACKATTTTSVLSLPNDCAISVMSPNRSKVAGIGGKKVDAKR